MGKKSFYAVAKGRQTGIFRSWAECEASVKGYPSDFKGFATYEEAAAFLEQKGVSLNPPDDWAKGGRVYSSPSLASPAAVSGAVAGTKRPWADLAKDCPNQGQPPPNPSSFGLVGCDLSAGVDRVFEGLSRHNRITGVLPYGASDPAAAQAHMLWFDGGSRGNGQAGAVAGSGTVLYRGATRVWQGGQYLGCTTNNVAEYTGLLHGLEVAKKLGVAQLEVRGDSKLVLLQVKGEWRCEKPHLQALCARAKELVQGFRACSLVHVPRAENAEADALANRAMDARQGFETYERLGAGAGAGACGNAAAAPPEVVDLTADSDGTPPSGSKRCKAETGAAQERAGCVAPTAAAAGEKAAADGGLGDSWEAQRDALDAGQRRALDAVLGGLNVFLTGGPGTGKSHTLRTIIKAIKATRYTVSKACCI